MPDFLITSPFKWNGEIKSQGMITLNAEEAEPLVCSGSLVPVLESLELTETNQVFTLDMSTMALTPVSAGERQVLGYDPAMPGAETLKQVFVVAEGRTLEHKGKSYIERQFILLSGEEVAPLIESGDVITMEQLAETMRQAEMAEDVAALEAKKAQDEVDALAAKKAKDEADALAAKKAQNEAAALAAKKAQEKAAAKKATTAKE